MARGRLNQDERYRIHAQHEAGHSLRAIATCLGRAPSTISRELKRNSVQGRYHPEHAHECAQRRRFNASTRCHIDSERKARIVALLAQDWSPQQIAGSTGLASHEWIYQHIYRDQRQGGQLFRHLRRGRRRRRRRGLRCERGLLRNRRSLHERPEVVEQRSRIGDWEIDTIHGSQGPAVVVSMTERRSRVHLLAWAPDRTANHVARALLQRLGRRPEWVHTLTADNGKEFAEHQLIEAALRAHVYFADRHSPWQRGSNENANGLTRQYLPRSTDFNAITPATLRRIENRLNTRPRKTLGYRTPLAVFAESIVIPVANQS